MKFTVSAGVLLILVSLSVVRAGSQAPVSKTGMPRILFMESLPTTMQESIVTMDWDGANPAKLATGTGTPLAANWSPDGCRILYRLGVRNNADRSMQGRLFLANADGSNSKEIASDVGRGPENGLQNYFSPDGSKIVFVSRSNDIMVVNSDGSGVKKLTNQLYAFQPSWSSDGTKILFMTNGLPHRIRVVDPDGSNLQDIGGGNEAQWSPDGSKIMFVQVQQTSSAIAVMRPDGTDVKVLTNGSGAVLHPSWSPDGKKIAFIALGQDDLVLEAMDADGSHRSKITDHLLVDLEVGQGPSWSPDGSALAVQRLPFSMKEMGAQMATNGPLSLHVDIYTLGADGANPRKLTSSGINMNPKWSPTPKCK
jgi:Tol biopolymer transport system component